jgi:hypothetical protein
MPGPPWARGALRALTSPSVATAAHKAEPSSTRLQSVFAPFHHSLADCIMKGHALAARSGRAMRRDRPKAKVIPRTDQKGMGSDETLDRMVGGHRPRRNLRAVDRLWWRRRRTRGGSSRHRRFGS